MEVSCHLYAPVALLLVKETPLPIGKEAMLQIQRISFAGGQRRMKKTAVK
jgi:hypothetical protein